MTGEFYFLCLEKEHEVLFIRGCEKYVKIVYYDYIQTPFFLPHLIL